MEWKHHLEEEKSKRISKCIFCTAACIVAIVVISLHLTPRDMPAKAAIIGISSGTALTAGIWAHSLHMSTSEIERAVEFIKNLETKLGELHDCVSTVHANTDTLTMVDRRECGRHLATII